MTRTRTMISRLLAVARHRAAIIVGAVSVVAIIVMACLAWFGPTTHTVLATSAGEAIATPLPEGIEMTTTHDFGVVVTGEQQLTHEFLCRNSGSRPLALRVLGRGCNCIDVTCPGEVLPGESKPVLVTVETRNRVGPFRTAVHLATSDPVVPQIDLEIKFSGIARVMTDPPALVFQNAMPSASLSAEFELIRVVPRNAGALADAKIATSNLAIRCEPVGDEASSADLQLGTATRRARRYAVHIDAARLPRDGQMRLSQEIVIDGGSAAEFRLPIEIVFRRHSTIVGPSSVLLQRSGEGRVARVTLRGRSSTPVRISRVMSTIDGVRASFKTQERGQVSQVLEFTLENEHAPAAAGKCEVWFDEFPNEPYCMDVMLVE